jgi:hypothetical protein
MKQLFVLVLAGFVLVPFVAAADESLLDEVLEMLGKGVDSAVVLSWLDQQTRPVAKLSSDDVIALSDAGASNELVQKLIAMSEASPPPATPTPAPVVAPVPASAAVNAPADGMSEVVVRMRYRYTEDSGDEFNKHWTLHAYLDGEPLIWATSEGSFSKKWVKKRVSIEPGRHVIRFMRESHTRKGKEGWRHESLASPDAVEFEVGPGSGWLMSLEWIESSMASFDSGPLTWQLSRRDVPVDGDSKTGAEFEAWPQLCDDMRANVPEGGKTPSWVKRNLKDCVEWSSLWPDSEAVAARPDVLTAMAEDDFRPPRVVESGDGG